MKRLITLFLLLAMLISCFALASCGDKKGAGSNDGGASSSDAGDNTNPEEIFDPTSLDLPSDLNYGDADFNILTFESNYPEFCKADNTNPDAVERSLKERDAFVNERLGVNITYQIEPGGWGKHYEFSDFARSSIELDNKAFDLIAGYALIPANLALYGILTDMNESKYINLDKTWYPDFMVDVCTINDQTYFLTGDFSPSALYRMECVVVNPTLAAQYDISVSDLYQMVYDGTWTIEALFQMGKDIGGKRLTTDTADDWNEEDFYAIRATEAAAVDGIFHGAGLITMYETEDGTVEIADDITGDICQKLYKLVIDTKMVDHAFFDSDNNAKPVVEGKSVFAYTVMQRFRTHFTDIKLDVLPDPKWESGADTNYTTWVASHHQYCIPNDLDDTERSAAVLEALGFAGYTYVVPTVFTKTMKLQYSANNDASNMFDIMRDTRSFSISSAFYMTYHSYDYEDADGGCIFRYAVSRKNAADTWTSDYKTTYEPSLLFLKGILNDFYN